MGHHPVLQLFLATVRMSVQTFSLLWLGVTIMAATSVAEIKVPTVTPSAWRVESRMSLRARV